MPDRRDLPSNEKMRLAGQDAAPRKMNPWLMLLSASLGSFLFVGACLCGGAWWWFRPAIHEDPAAAERLVREIVDIQLTEKLWEPRGTIEWNLALLFEIRGAYFSRRGGDGVLALVEVNSPLTDAEEVQGRIRNVLLAEGTGSQDVQAHLRETLLAEGVGGNQLTIDPALAKVHAMTIREREVAFQMNVADTSAPGSELQNRFHLVEGVFPGKNGEVLLSLRLPENQWNEAEVLAMLESIGGSVPQETPPPVPAVENVLPNEE